jgi:serine/threonine protein kinase
MKEEPLAGGRMTAGVVRIGDTVRRPPQPNSPFVRELLEHLAQAGFGEAPRYLGTDEQGRECFSYLSGEVPPDLGLHSDATLCAAGRLIRGYHDATVGFVTEAEVICHNDLSPCNAVFRERLPIALIDFDAAAPGDRLWDLGYAAWLWVDIGNEELARGEQLRRLEVFARAYDPELRAEDVIPVMVQRQRELGSQPGDGARQAWASDCLQWTLANFKA